MCFRVTGINFVTYMDCCCSVTKSCLTLFDPMKCIMPGFPVLHCLPEFAEIILYSAALLSSCPKSFPVSGSFPVSRLFTSGGQSIGASVSASVLLMSMQDCFPSGLIDLLAVQGTQESSLTKT